MFQATDSMRNTSATTVVAKSSMKPWHSAIANCNLCGRDHEGLGFLALKSHPKTSLIFT